MSPSVQSPAPGSAFHPGDATAACGRRGRAARQRQATAAGRARPPQRAVGQVCLGAAQSRECALRHAGGEGGVDGTVMAPVMLLSSPSSSSICQRLARANSDMPDRPRSTDREVLFVAMFVGPLPRTKPSHEVANPSLKGLMLPARAARAAMSAAPRRALSFRRSALQVAGRNGHAGSSRIMPAVGDQAQARTTSPDKDDDWIKVDQYVAGLNPNILQEANTALKREKWRGEGVQQAVFAQPCVQAVGSVTVSCSSAPMAARVQRLLAALCGGGGDAGFQCGGLQLKVKLMGQDWFRSLRSIRKPPECARFEAVEFVSAADSVGGLQKACAEREIACAQDGEDACSLSPTPGKSAGLFQQVGLALSSTIEALPPKFAVRLASAAPTPLPATPSPGDNPLQIRVREIVIGAEWGEHGAYERMLDRIAGSASRLSLGLWQLPGGPAIRSRERETTSSYGGRPSCCLRGCTHTNS